MPLHNLDDDEASMYSEPGEESSFNESTSSLSGWNPRSLSLSLSLLIFISLFFALSSLSSQLAPSLLRFLFLLFLFLLFLCHLRCLSLFSLFRDEKRHCVLSKIHLVLKSSRTDVSLRQKPMTGQLFLLQLKPSQFLQRLCLSCLPRHQSRKWPYLGPHIRYLRLPKI